MVFDAETGYPLHFANVLLSGTTLGAATDSTGVFSIVNIPLGVHELVVSNVPPLDYRPEKK